MTENTDQKQDRRDTLWGFLIALAIIVVLALAFVLFGLPGVGMVMVIATPIIVGVLVLISVGR